MHNCRKSVAVHQHQTSCCVVVLRARELSSLVAFVICSDSEQPEQPGDRDETVQINSIFGSGSEWIILGELGTELQLSLSELRELISKDWELNFC